MVQHKPRVFWLNEQQDKVVDSEGAGVFILFLVFDVLEQLLLLVKCDIRRYADQAEAVLPYLRVLLIHKLERRLDQSVPRKEQNGELVLLQQLCGFLKLPVRDFTGRDVSLDKVQLVEQQMGVRLTFH